MYGARGGLRDAFTARTYLLYPTLYHTRHALGSGAVSFGQHDILRAVARTIGRNIDELAYLSEDDIRAGIALLIAALSAEGSSRIDNIDQIDRGYESIDKRLNSLGAHITRIPS